MTMQPPLFTMPFQRFIKFPRITVISVPQFIEPPHLPVNWVGAATPGEQLVEFSGRLCYMSQHNPANKTTTEYLGNIRSQGHGSVLEHANYSLLCEGVSRSFTHELVRHRAGFAYSQLSQRYVDESEVQFVTPPAYIGTDREALWEGRMEQARIAYIAEAEWLYEKYSDITDKVHRRKTAREAARSVLPNATETKIVVTANLRAWRTMLELRSSQAAEREIRRWAVEVIRIMKVVAPSVFNDVDIRLDEQEVHYGVFGTHKV